MLDAAGTARSASFRRFFDFRKLQPKNLLQSALRPGLCRLAWFRYARRAPVICSPALQRRPGEQITSARCSLRSNPFGGFSFYRSLRSLKLTGRCASSCALADSNLPPLAPAKLESAAAPELAPLPSDKRWARRCQLGPIQLPSGEYSTSASSSRIFSSSPPLRPSFGVFAWIRSAWQPPVICSPGLLRRSGEQITFGRTALRSTSAGLFSGRCAPSDHGSLRIVLRFG